MGQEDEELLVKGSVEGLAKGERIFSVRFEGNVGFVVTFRQIDPLFAFDLSDPVNPVLKGELKIPGFSTYMHPLQVDEQGTPEFLLTIGENADENGVSLGMQLSIFDVRDLSNPIRVEKHVLEGEWTHSEALYNHKAFGYYPEHKLLAIPVSNWSRN